MKKRFLMLVIFCFSILVGCTLGNTPTSKAEDLLSKYQMLDDDISVSYSNLTTDTGLSQDLRARYEELVRKQYRNLSYEVKEEEIDGDTAIVTVQIEVMDYKTIIYKYDNSDYTQERYHELVLDDLESAKEKITYTIRFNLSKDDDDMWQVDDLSTTDREKLLGIN